jgi:hypothetical protein
MYYYNAKAKDSEKIIFCVKFSPFKKMYLNENSHLLFDIKNSDVSW